jgi:hypothetical protein
MSSGNGLTGITGDLIEMVGLTEEQYRLFRELEISPQRLYIFLDCRVSLTVNVAPFT